MSPELTNSLANAGESDTHARPGSVELFNSLFIESDAVVGNRQMDRVLFPAGRNLGTRCTGVTIDIDQALL